MGTRWEKMKTVVRGKGCWETDANTLQGFVADHAVPGATVYTDNHGAGNGKTLRTVGSATLAGRRGGAIAASDASTNPVRGAAARTPRSNTRREHDRAF